MNIPWCLEGDAHLQRNHGIFCRRIVAIASSARVQMLIACSKRTVILFVVTMFAFRSSCCSAYPNATTEELRAVELWFESLGKFVRWHITCLVLRVDTRELPFEWKVYALWFSLGSPLDVHHATRKSLYEDFQVRTCYLDYRQSTYRRLSE